MRDEDQMIAEARQRDERAATALGDDTPLEGALHTSDERTLLWHDFINFRGRDSASGPDDLTFTTRALLERVHALRRSMTRLVFAGLRTGRLVRVVWEAGALFGCLICLAGSLRVDPPGRRAAVGRCVQGRGTRRAERQTEGVR